MIRDFVVQIIDRLQASELTQEEAIVLREMVQSRARSRVVGPGDSTTQARRTTDVPCWHAGPPVHSSGTHGPSTGGRPPTDPEWGKSTLRLQATNGRSLGPQVVDNNVVWNIDDDDPMVSSTGFATTPYWNECCNNNNQWVDRGFKWFTPGEQLTAGIVQFVKRVLGAFAVISHFRFRAPRA